MNKYFQYLKVEILHDLKQKKLSQSYCLTKNFYAENNYKNFYHFLKFQKIFLLTILISFKNFFLILRATFIQIFYKKKNIKF